MPSHDRCKGVHGLSQVQDFVFDVRILKGRKFLDYSSSIKLGYMEQMLRFKMAGLRSGLTYLW